MLGFIACFYAFKMEIWSWPCWLLCLLCMHRPGRNVPGTSHNGHGTKHYEIDLRTPGYISM
jgi:hypothetical protein